VWQEENHLHEDISGTCATSRFYLPFPLVKETLIVSSQKLSGSLADEYNNEHELPVAFHMSGKCISKMEILIL
jgi:hypothetical protein